MARLTRTRQVLTGATVLRGDDHVTFTREPDEPGDIPTIISFSCDTWQEMGMVDTITITIEPGDHLNTDG